MSVVFKFLYKCIQCKDCYCKSDGLFFSIITDAKSFLIIIYMIYMIYMIAKSAQMLVSSINFIPFSKLDIRNELLCLYFNVVTIQKQNN